MPKVSKNLFLDEEAVARGERYSALHETNVSKLVSDFLGRLPLHQPARELAPIVSRLLGIASGKHDRGTYREHLWKKYGR